MPVDKISEEWVVMRYFREKYEHFPKGKLLKYESPDFVLVLNRKKRIGIELTRLDYLLKDKIIIKDVSNQFLKLMDKKEAKLTAYRKNRLNAYWLIVTVDSFELLDVDNDKSLRQLDLNTSFDKVFLFDLFSAAIIELI